MRAMPGGAGNNANVARAVAFVHQENENKKKLEKLKNEEAEIVDRLLGSLTQRKSN
jgi:hypothetical protein